MSDFFSWKNRETEEVRAALTPLKPTSAKRYHIRHGAQVMAMSMGIKSLAHVSPDRLYLWAFKRYERLHRRHKPGHWPAEDLARTQLFHYGRDIVRRHLKGGAR